MANQKIITGDALPKMQAMQAGTFDVVVTSPIYNLGTKYRHCDDDLPHGEYLEWIGKVFREVERVMKSHGSLFLNVGFTNKSPWLAFDIASVLRPFLTLQNQIVWVKSIHVEGTTSYGHFQPMNSRRFVSNCYEYIFHFTKTGKVPVDRLGAGVPYADKANAKRWGKDADLRCRGNTWFVPYETLVREPVSGLNAGKIPADDWLSVSEAGEIAGLNLGIITKGVDAGEIASNGERGRRRRIYPTSFQSWLDERKKPKNPDHPAIFPWKLAQMCIQLAGVRSDMKVMDPFVGLGSTLVACKRLNVNGIGIEIDPECARMARKRLAET